jgi:hypothetical protein
MLWSRETCIPALCHVQHLREMQCLMFLTLLNSTGWLKSFEFIWLYAIWSFTLFFVLVSGICKHFITISSLTHKKYIKWDYSRWRSWSEVRSSSRIIARHCAPFHYSWILHQDSPLNTVLIFCPCTADAVTRRRITHTHTHMYKIIILT